MVFRRWHFVLCASQPKSSRRQPPRGPGSHVHQAHVHHWRQALQPGGWALTPVLALEVSGHVPYPGFSLLSY